MYSIIVVLVAFPHVFPNIIISETEILGITPRRCIALGGGSEAGEGALYGYIIITLHCIRRFFYRNNS